MTCSVHAVPDQYRCSWRTKGSTNHPGAVPVKPGPVPDDVAVTGSGTGGDPVVVGGCEVKPWALPGWPERPPWRRRCDDSRRMTTATAKGMITSHEWAPLACMYTISVYDRCRREVSRPLRVLQSDDIRSNVAAIC